MDVVGALAWWELCFGTILFHNFLLFQMNLKPAIFFIRLRCILRHPRFLVFLSSLRTDLRTVVKLKASYIVNFNREGLYYLIFWHFDVGTPAAVARFFLRFLDLPSSHFSCRKVVGRSFKMVCGRVLIRRRRFYASGGFVRSCFLCHLVVVVQAVLLRCSYLNF